MPQYIYFFKIKICYQMLFSLNCRSVIIANLQLTLNACKYIRHQKLTSKSHVCAFVKLNFWQVYSQLETFMVDKNSCASLRQSTDIQVTAR